MFLVDHNPCKSNPCMNGAICNTNAGLYTCTCKEYYVGLNCERESFVHKKTQCTRDKISIPSFS